MRPEILTALTSPNGVAFADRGASARELAERRWFTPGIGNTNGHVRWNPPRGTRTYSSNRWTHVECALACQGLDDRYFQAIQYEYAMNDAMYYPMKRTLLAFANSEKRRLHWPDTVTTSDGHLPYLERLCEVLLLEIRQPWRFVRASNAPGMWRLLMRCDERTWRLKLSPIYECLRDEHRRWIAVGLGHMRRWLGDEP